MSSEVNRCPFCDEEVRVMALKCKHCGSTLDDASNMADSRRGVRIKDRAAKHKKRAEDYKKGGAYSQAESEIKAALELDPTDSSLLEFKREIDALIKDRHLATAEALVKAYKFEEVVFEYHAILEENPQDVDAKEGVQKTRKILRRLSKHVQKGDAHRKNREYQEAIKEFEQVLQINPNHKYAKSEAEQCRLICEEHNLLFAKASEDLEAAESEYEHGRYGKAISSALRVLEKVPDHTEAIALIDRSKKERFRSRRNVLILTVIILASGTYIYAMYGIWNYTKYRSFLEDSRVAAENRNWDDAIDYCTTALQYRPKSEEAQMLLSSYIDKGDQSVRKAEQQALWAKEQAKRMRAPSYAGQEYAQAEEAERQADSHYLVKEYGLAQTYYLKAFEKYGVAEEKASRELERLGKLEREQERLKREQEEMQEQEITLYLSNMKAAMAKADSELAGHYAVESYFRARKKMRAGDEAYQMNNLTLAAQNYEQAASLFSQSAKEARDGGFLPDGLEKGEGRIVSLKDDAEMVYVPAGSYQAGNRAGKGASNEYPRHRVNLEAFYMDKHEVTIGQYGKFIRDTGRKHHPSLAIEDSSRAKYPVTGINREDAIAYAEWAGKRLPTEAEWEYACRAGTMTLFGIGKSMDHDKANYSGIKGENQWNGTAPVGSFEANSWGLFDMHGNVWEWCQDWYGRNYYKNCPPANPKGPAEGTHAVIRGGSWKEAEYSLRSALRGFYPPAGSRNDLGFRCVK